MVNYPVKYLGHPAIHDAVISKCSRKYYLVSGWKEDASEATSQWLNHLKFRYELRPNNFKSIRIHVTKFHAGNRSCILSLKSTCYKGS